MASGRLRLHPHLVRMGAGVWDGARGDLWPRVSPCTCRSAYRVECQAAYGMVEGVLVCSYVCISSTCMYKRQTVLIIFVPCASAIVSCHGEIVWISSFVYETYSHVVSSLAMLGSRKEKKNTKIAMHFAKFRSKFWSAKIYCSILFIFGNNCPTID
jgi:hypothetical protein